MRPVTLIHFQKRLLVATGSGDAKVKQIRSNPKTEFCLLLERGDQKGTLRASAQQVSSTTRRLNQTFSQKCPAYESSSRPLETPGTLLYV